MEPVSRLLTFAWDGSLVAECSLNFGLDHLTSWKWSLLNAMWCLCNWIFTERKILWKMLVDLIIFSSFLLCFSTDASSVFLHIQLILFTLFSIFCFPSFCCLFVCSFLSILHLSTCSLPLFLSLLSFYTFSLSGGHLGPSDLWPPGSERVSVVSRWNRKWEWWGGVR